MLYTVSSSRRRSQRAHDARSIVTPSPRALPRQGRVQRVSSRRPRHHAAQEHPRRHLSVQTRTQARRYVCGAADEQGGGGFWPRRRGSSPLVGGTCTNVGNTNLTHSHQIPRRTPIEFSSAWLPQTHSCLQVFGLRRLAYFHRPDFKKAFWFARSTAIDETSSSLSLSLSVSLSLSLSQTHTQAHTCAE